MGLFKRKNAGSVVAPSGNIESGLKYLDDRMSMLSRVTVRYPYDYNDKSLEERVKELERRASLSDDLHEATNRNGQDVWRRIMEFESRLSALEAKAKK
jgi:hypothetical protein